MTGSGQWPKSVLNQSPRLFQVPHPSLKDVELALAGTKGFVSHQVPEWARLVPMFRRAEAKVRDISGSPEIQVYVFPA